MTKEKEEDLEKENAELKKKCQDRCDECWEEHIKLTKAKELLTRFVMASVYFNGKEIELIKEAEQFLKEIEK